MDVKRFVMCSCCGTLVEHDWAEQMDPEFFGPDGDGPLLCEACRADEPPEADEYDYAANEADRKYACP